MALFKNPTSRHISTSIDGYPVKATPGGTCEIPDHKAFAVALIGLPLVPWEQPKDVDPPTPDKPVVAPVAPEIAPVVVAPVAPEIAPVVVAPVVVAPVPVVVSSIADRPPVATMPVLTAQDTKGRGGRAPTAKDAAPASPILANEKSVAKP